MASLFRLAVDKFNSTAGSVRDWASRNRRKIVIAAIVSGSAALIVYLVRGKLHQIQQPKEEDKREVAREKLSNVQKSCNSIIIKEIVPNLQQKLIELVPIPSKAALRAALKGTSQEKLAIWQEAQVQCRTEDES